MSERSEKLLGVAASGVLVGAIAFVRKLMDGYVPLVEALPVGLGAGGIALLIGVVLLLLGVFDEH